MMYYVVDGGSTLGGLAARRHPQYKGQPVFHALLQYGFLDVAPQWPSLQKVRWNSMSYRKYYAEFKQHDRKEDPRIIVQKV